MEADDAEPEVTWKEARPGLPERGTPLTVCVIRTVW